MKDLLEEYGNLAIGIIVAAIFISFLIYAFCTGDNDSVSKGLLGEKIMSILDKGVWNIIERSVIRELTVTPYF